MGVLGTHMGAQVVSSGQGVGTCTCWGAAPAGGLPLLGSQAASGPAAARALPLWGSWRALSGCAYRWDSTFWADRCEKELLMGEGSGKEVKARVTVQGTTTRCCSALPSPQPPPRCTHTLAVPPSEKPEQAALINIYVCTHLHTHILQISVKIFLFYFSPASPY